MLDAVAVLDERNHRELASVFMATEDADLVIRCQDGDQVAFQELVEKHRQKVYWIAYDITSDREAARDISQDAFIRVFKSIHGFNPQNSFEGWVRRIATNLSIDELRARARKQQDVSLDALMERPAETDSPDQQMQAQEERELVVNVLEKLPLKYRTVLALRDIHGMSYQEIARVISRPSATVRWRIHAARKRFKEHWERVVERRGTKEE